MRSLTFLMLGLLGVCAPRTVLARAPFEGPDIGVLLARGPSALEVFSDTGLFVETLEGQFLLPAGRHGFAFEEERVRLGRDRFEALRLHARDGAPTGVGLEAGQSPRFYRGWIEIIPGEGGNDWTVINRVPLELYLPSVVQSEMPASFGAAALEAQAVAARTYALYHIYRWREEPRRYHVTPDSKSQVYKGVGRRGEIHENALRAVEATRGQVLLYQGARALPYQGKIFECFYHSTCGGSTRSAVGAFGGPDLECLTSVSCGHCEASRHSSWELVLSARQVQQVLAGLLRGRLEVEDVRSLTPVGVESGGHAMYIRVEHAGGRFDVDATEFRLACLRRKIRMKSCSFMVRRDGDNFVFYDGRGFGHGVGMCQWGARGMAIDAGFSSAQILLHYYPMAEISRLW